MKKFKCYYRRKKDELDKELTMIVEAKDKEEAKREVKFRIYVARNNDIVFHKVEEITN